MPLTSTTLGDLLRRAGAAFGERPAILLRDAQYSFAELARRAEEKARLLAGAGLNPGDRIAVWFPNGVEFIEWSFGAAMCGLIVVPLNTRLKQADAAHALDRSGARALFFTQEFIGIDFFELTTNILAAHELPALTIVVNVGERSAQRISRFADWSKSIVPAAQLPVVAADSIAFINFTSGTTSRPKGAMIRHKTLMHVAREVGKRMQFSERDFVASAMPFYHNGGFVPTLLTGLMFGASLYTQARFDPDDLLDAVTRLKGTVISGAGTMFTMMLDSPRMPLTDFSHVRAVRITGPADMRRAVKAGFGKPMIYSLYGMTETTAAVTLTCPDDDVDEQMNTNGKPLPDCAIRIEGSNGEALGPEQRGEILIGGDDCLMGGYFGDANATAEVLKDGWVRSGDIGYMDRKGNLILIGRIKDMYRSGSENVACAEVEEFLREHPAVLHAAVFGVPDPRLEEVGFAYVELREGMTATEEELQQHCRRNLANFKTPRYIRFRKDLPLTVTGRVEKRNIIPDALRELGLAQNA
jgi:acyl-CoA synthetase (AMP-forming)/AMP-acid ligase II